MKIRVIASNGQFAGVADVYVDAESLREAAAELECFPVNPLDSKEIKFGEFGVNSSGGAIWMKFYCTDNAGHSFVDCKIESDHGLTDKAQSAEIVFPIEPAAVDKFVRELSRLGAMQEGKAYLKA